MLQPSGKRAEGGNMQQHAQRMQHRIPVTDLLKQGRAVQVDGVIVLVPGRRVEQTDLCRRCGGRGHYAARCSSTVVTEDWKGDMLLAARRREARAEGARRVEEANNAKTYQHNNTDAPSPRTTAAPAGTYRAALLGTKTPARPNTIGRKPHTTYANATPPMPEEEADDSSAVEKGRRKAALLQLMADELTSEVAILEEQMHARAMFFDAYTSTFPRARVSCTHCNWLGHPAALPTHMLITHYAPAQQSTMYLEIQARAHITATEATAWEVLAETCRAQMPESMTNALIRQEARLSAERETQRRAHGVTALPPQQTPTRDPEMGENEEDSPEQEPLDPFLTASTDFTPELPLFYPPGTTPSSPPPQKSRVAAANAKAAKKAASATRSAAARRSEPTATKPAPTVLRHPELRTPPGELKERMRTMCDRLKEDIRNRERQNQHEDTAEPGATFGPGMCALTSVLGGMAVSCDQSLPEPFAVMKNRLAITENTPANATNTAIKMYANYPTWAYPVITLEQQAEWAYHYTSKANKPYIWVTASQYTSIQALMPQSTTMQATVFLYSGGIVFDPATAHYVFVAGQQPLPNTTLGLYRIYQQFTYPLDMQTIDTLPKMYDTVEQEHPADMGCGHRKGHHSQGTTGHRPPLHNEENTHSTPHTPRTNNADSTSQTTADSDHLAELLSDTEEDSGEDPSSPAEEPGQRENEETHDTPRWAHGQLIPRPQATQCPCCDMSWTTNRCLHQLISHANTAHDTDTRRHITNTALATAAVDRCERCAQIVIASTRARAAHHNAGKCGHYVTRQALNIMRGRGSGTARLTFQQVPPPPAHDTMTQTGPPPEEAEADTHWLLTNPATVRVLHKREWGAWCDSVGRVLLGYTASDTAERYRRQVALTDLVRLNLTRHKTNSQDTQGQSHSHHTPADPFQATSTPYETPPHTATADHAAETNPSKRIMHLLELGALGKAARTLFHKQLPRAPPEIAIPQLESLHPQEDPTAFPHPDGVPFFHDLSPAVVQRTIGRRLGRGAAPGLDGWTRELLIPLTEKKELLRELTTVVQDILACRVSHRFAARIRACAINPFLKEPGSTKIRPITPESVWLKLAGLIALDAVDNTFAKAFAGWQFGVWGDATIAVDEIRSAYAAPSATTLVALDATNAYNRISRRHVLQSVFGDERLRAIWGITDLALGTPSPLGLYEDSQRVAHVTSSSGVRQGMVLGPLLFSAALLVLRPLLEAHPHIKLIAYLDDLTVIGAHARVQSFLDAAVPVLEHIGFNINPQKSTVLQKTPPDTGGPLTVGGVPLATATGVTRILGAGFAPDGGSVEPWVRERTAKYDAYFDALQRSSPLPMHARLALLRGSQLPRLGFLLRTHAPADLQDSARWFDQRVIETLTTIVGMPLTQEATLIAQLPFAKGGLGLRAQEPIAAFASQCLREKGEQSQRTKDLDQQKYDTLKPLLTEPGVALLQAGGSPGAIRALADPAVSLPDAPFQALLRQRLLLRVLPQGQTCLCGADATNDHVMTCSRLPGGPRIYRHNAIVDCIAQWAAELGFRARTEPRADSNNKSRLDLAVSTPDALYVADAVVTYAGARRHAAGQSAVDAAFLAKQAKWERWASLAGAVFAPIAMDSEGGLQRRSLRWLASLAGRSSSPYASRTAIQDLLTRLARSLHVQNLSFFNVVTLHQAERQLVSANPLASMTAVGA